MPWVDFAVAYTGGRNMAFLRPTLNNSFLHFILIFDSAKQSKSMGWGLRKNMVKKWQWFFYLFIVDLLSIICL